MIVPSDEDHPFPVKELNMIIKLNKEEKLAKEDIEILSNILAKYLELRAYVFHEF